MEWIQFLIVVMTIGSFLWMARSDYRHLDARIDANHKEIVQMMMDFHGKLERQEADFKSFMKEQERERTRIILGK